MSTHEHPVHFNEANEAEAKLLGEFVAAVEVQTVFRLKRQEFLQPNRSEHEPPLKPKQIRIEN